MKTKPKSKPKKYRKPEQPAALLNMNKQECMVLIGALWYKLNNSYPGKDRKIWEHFHSKLVSKTLSKLVWMKWYFDPTMHIYFPEKEDTLLRYQDALSEYSLCGGDLTLGNVNSIIILLWERIDFLRQDLSKPSFR